MFKKSTVLVFGLMMVTGQVLAEDNAALKTDKEKLSYSIGASIGKNLKNESTMIDLNVLVEALKTTLAGEKPLMTDKEVRQVMNDYQTQMRQHALATKQIATADNKKKGEAFLADYKSQAGVLALPSGVLYKVIKAGEGKKPMESDMVEVNYRGTLINGTEFDATAPDHPANLKVSALIPGWKEALTAMPAGSKWHIVVPSQSAYGERGVGGDIGPNEVLVFDVELLNIK